MAFFHQFNRWSDVGTSNGEKLSEEVTIFFKYFPLLCVASYQLTAVLHNPKDVVSVVGEPNNVNQTVEVYLPDVLDEVGLIYVPQNHID